MLHSKCFIYISELTTPFTTAAMNITAAGMCRGLSIEEVFLFLFVKILLFLSDNCNLRNEYNN